MKRHPPIRSQIRLGTMALLFLSLCLTVSPCFGQKASRPLGPGDPFPDFSLPNNLSLEESSYLGVPVGGEVSVSALKPELLLIEFLNVYCHTCREQVPIFNELRALLQKDPVMFAKVKILGIAVKGTPEEIREFKREFGAAYPILSDAEKNAFAAIGSPPATPHTYLVGPAEGGKRFVLDYHRGGVESPQAYLREIRQALKGELGGFEPGNAIPDLKVVGADGLSRYRGRYLLLYLPPTTTYPTAEDLRNATNQLRELEKAGEQLKDEVVILALPSRDLSEPKITAALKGQVSFLSDPDQDLRTRMGAPQDPLILVVNETGRISFRGPSITFASLRELVQGKLPQPPRLDLSEGELHQIILGKMTQINPRLVSLEPVKLENGETIWVGTPPPGERSGHLFAKLVSKSTLCDVCHDTHFFYVVDQEGIVRAFVPLSITKYGNEEWDKGDIAKIESRIVGKSLFSPFPFDPRVDAVAMATMSSSLIYEGLAEGALVFGELKKFDFRAEHWKRICFQNICRLKEAMEKAKAASPGEWEFDLEAIIPYLPEKKMPLCPLEGMYVEYEGDILCSYHGLNLDGCR